MRDGDTELADPHLTTGQRVKFYRQRRGISRDVLGGLVGKTGRWVKAVESGQIRHPKLPDLIALAEALKIRDLARLTGGRPLPITLFRGPGHPALPAVRDAVNAVVVRPDGPPPLDHLSARIGAAWRARHAAPDHRAVLGGLLPDLIRDARQAVRAYESDDRRRALALLAGTYNLAQFFVAYQPDSGLLWRIAERALMAAGESEDPRAFGGAVWGLVEAHRDAGDLDAAEAVNRDALEVLRPRLADPGDELRGMWGALCFAAAYTAARSGQEGEAWRWWDEANRVAHSLPAAFYDPMTSFSRVVMGAHAVTVAVELRKRGEARRQARRTGEAAIPSRPRRGRHLVEVARAWQIAGDDAGALGALETAYSAAPDTVRYNSHARRMIVEYGSGPAELRRPALNLADRVGLLV